MLLELHVKFSTSYYKNTRIVLNVIPFKRNARPPTHPSRFKAMVGGHKLKGNGTTRLHEKRNAHKCVGMQSNNLVMNCNDKATIKVLTDMLGYALSCCLSCM